MAIAFLAAATLIALAALAIWSRTSSARRREKQLVDTKLDAQDPLAGSVGDATAPSEARAAFAAGEEGPTGPPG